MIISVHEFGIEKTKDICQNLVKKEIEDWDFDKRRDLMERVDSAKDAKRKLEIYAEVLRVELKF